MTTFHTFSRGYILPSSVQKIDAVGYANARLLRAVGNDPRMVLQIVLATLRGNRTIPHAITRTLGQYQMTFVGNEECTDAELAHVIQSMAQLRAIAATYNIQSLDRFPADAHTFVREEEVRQRSDSSSSSSSNSSSSSSSGDGSSSNPGGGSGSGSSSSFAASSTQ
jgi:uncharacterized membrane protein YgcG